MRVLVVGGAGYVGGALTDILEGHEVRVYDNLTYEEAYLKDVQLINGDIRDRKQLKHQLVWADAVVWLAAIVGDGACEINPVTSVEVNQEAVKFLADNFDGRIIFTSTCSVYGARDGVLTEGSPVKPLSVYASTKLAAEKHLKGKNAIIFRLGTLFGLGDRFSRIRLDLVLNTLTARAVSGGSLTVFGGDQYRPLLHVKDAAQALRSALEHNHVGTYNLHSENVRIIDLAEIVKFWVPCELNIVKTTFEDSRNYRVSSDKARKIGFAPMLEVDIGIQELSDLFMEGRIRDLNNSRYSNHAHLGSL